MIVPELINTLVQKEHISSIPGFVRVKNPGVEHTVKFQCYIICCDCALARNFHGSFFQTFDVCNTVEKRDQYSKARL